MSITIILEEAVDEKLTLRVIMSWAKLVQRKNLIKTAKGYSNEILNIFTSAFEVNNKFYVLTVILDEPKGSKKLWGHNRREAGWNAGYINGQIIKKIGPILNTLNFNEYAKLN